MGEGGTMPDGTIRSVIGLTEADVIAANFAALGIANVSQASTPDRTLAAYKELIAELGRLPSSLEVAKRIGLSVSSVRYACRDLESRGLMLKFKSTNGQWAYMPKVTP